MLTHISDFDIIFSLLNVKYNVESMGVNDIISEYKFSVLICKNNTEQNINIFFMVCILFLKSRRERIYKIW